MKRIIIIALLTGLAVTDKYPNPKRAVEPVYYRGQCQNNIGTVGSLLVVTEVDQGKTEIACNQLGGKLLISLHDLIASFIERSNLEQHMLRQCQSG